MFPLDNAATIFFAFRAFIPLDESGQPAGVVPMSSSTHAMRIQRTEGLMPRHDQLVPLLRVPRGGEVFPAWGLENSI